jgi:starch phosphorylase
MDVNEQADSLAQKIKHIMITNSGHTLSAATIEEFYQAFCLALREEIMINSVATIDTIQNKKCRMVNFISMEYLPGRLLANNISNMCAQELIKAVLVKLDKSYADLISCEAEPGLGNGGLGRLSSCFLDSLATLNYPARGYGLRYQYGIFEQEIWNGIQVERPDRWLLNEDPWESRRDLFAVSVHFKGTPIHATNKHGEEAYLLEGNEEVRALPFDTHIIGYSEKSNYSAILLRLWSTKESPRNFQLQKFNAGQLGGASENTALTDVLYPNDHTDFGKRLRLKQEFLLVSASLQDILRRHMRLYGDLSLFSDKVRIQLNDTHPAIMIAELMRALTKNYDYTWNDAWEICQACCSYTNHSILKEALEEWDEARLQELLPRQYRIIQKINQMMCNQNRVRFPNDEERIQRISIIEDGKVRMANLAIFGSHKVNGVAKLHTEILEQSSFKDFYEFAPEKFVSVTNGATHRRWLLNANPLLAEFITKRIGKSWITQFTDIKKLAMYASDPASQAEFLAIKKKNKEKLLSFLSLENFTRDAKGKVIAHSHILDPEALFDVQIKRFHEYKRQLMNALHLIMLYQEANPARIARLAIFGGKAAPGYQKAKQIMQLIYAISRKFHETPHSKHKLCIAFVENYNVSRAEVIIPAADLSEQISAAGWEASGTGNMKLSMNGALTIGTDDGANIEMRESVTNRWWPFRFGSSVEENRQDHNPWEIYNSDEELRNALNTLTDGTFAESADEEKSFADLFHELTEYDAFRVLKDLRAYYETQKKVEALYLTPNVWAETAIHNIAGMAPFSTDESIRNYAQKIWGIEPCPLDPNCLAKVREEYAEHDRCKIRR